MPKIGHLKQLVYCHRTSPSASKLLRFRDVNTLSKVDLPAPLEPMMASKVPGSAYPVTRKEVEILPFYH